MNPSAPLNSTQQTDTFGQSTQEGQYQPTKAVGAAGQNFSGKAAYQDLLYDGNVQRDQAGDVRPMEVPKTDSYGRRVSDFVGNTYGAEVTPDRMAASQVRATMKEKWVAWRYILLLLFITRGGILFLLLLLEW